MLAVASIAVSGLTIVFSVLCAVASLAVATLGVGLILGFVAGILLSPAMRRGAVWLSSYLGRN